MTGRSTVFLKRPVRVLKCTLISEYDHYPAVRIRIRGKEKIVGRSEIITPEEIASISKQRMANEARKEYARLIERWTPGMTWKKWRERGGECWVWNQVKKLQRLGIIPECDL